MSKSPERSKEESGQPQTETDLGLLETFNHALSSIIGNPEESSESLSCTSCSPKKQRPLIWFPDEDVRRSPEISPGSCVEPSAEIITQSIKQEDTHDHFDEYREWIDGSAKCRYSLTSRDAQSHSSGWAMKYTNNHNKYVLKKTCVGVLLCSKNCRLKDGRKIRIRPAISDKVRERQLGQKCPNSECNDGRVVHRKCTGNNGYPVTHFWVHHMDYIQFESKGHHDHPKPEAKRTSMRKREAQSAKYNVDEIIERTPQTVNTGYTPQQFLPYLRPDDLTVYSSCLDYHEDYVRSCDVTEGNEHVTVATAAMRELSRKIFSKDNNDSEISKTYVLCRTLANFIPGFDLLESRILSCATPECPLVLLTLYRSGAVDGILEHIKHLTVMCSSPLQKIRVPKWHYLVHDFPRELQTLSVETIVNLMVDTQMQTLLNEFQYKSVSSLYKMLRQKLLGTFRNFEEHYRMCKYELMLRTQDPSILSAAEDMLSRVQSRYCTTKEYLNVDALIKDGALGTHMCEFWYFWGSDLISSAVFPAAKMIYDSVLRQHHHYSASEGCNYLSSARIQDGFIAVMEWLHRRNTIYPYSMTMHSCLASQRSTGLNSNHFFTYVHNKLPALLPYSGAY